MKNHNSVDKFYYIIKENEIIHIFTDVFYVTKNKKYIYLHGKCIFRKILISEWKYAN